MTTKAKSGGAKSGAAARAEKAEKPQTVEYRGLTLTLPSELPPTLLFDITEIEVAGKNPLPIFRMLRSLLGAEQFTAVRNEIADNEGDVADIGELVNAVFESYGMTAGEAPASPASSTSNGTPSRPTSKGSTGST